jgi:PAS domain S-box-containing protein
MAGRAFTGVAVAVLAAFLVAAAIEHPGARKGPSDWVQLAKSLLVAGAVLAVAWRCRSSSRRLARSWTLVGLGCLCYALGDVFWIVFDVTLRQPPATYVMEAAYLLFYPLFLAGVLGLPRQPLSVVERAKLLLDTAIVLLAAAVILWTVLVNPLLAHQAGSQRGLAIVALYPVGDLALLYALLSLFFERREPEATRIYRLLAVGTVVLIAADGNYVYQILSGHEGLAFWTGLGWTAGPLLIAIAAMGQVSPRPLADGATTEGFRRWVDEKTAVLVAFGCLLASWVVIIAWSGGAFSPVATVGIVAMAIVALARQLVGQAESDRLLARLQRARRELEERVRDRTSELAQANAGLEDEIAERRRVESALRESESRYRTLFLDSPISLWEEDFSRVKELIDGLGEPARADFAAFLASHREFVVLCARATKVVDVNRATLTLFGASSKEELLDGLWSIFGSGTLRLFREEVAVLASGRTTFGGEADFRKLSGEPIRAFYQVAIAPGFESSWAKVFISVIDLTERTAAEEALKRSEERFRALVQNAHDIVTIHAPDGRITYQSPALERLLGYTPESLVGRNPLEFVHPQDVGTVRQGLERVAEGSTTGIPTEYRVKRADGTWAHVESVGVNLSAHPGIEGLVMTTRDVGERKRAEAEIRRKLRELTLLSSAAAIAVEAADEETLVVRTTAAIRDVLFPDNCGILLVDERAGALRHTQSYHTGRAEYREVVIPLGTGITGQVAVSGVGRLVPDTTADPDYLALDPDMRSELCVPLKAGERVLGVIDAESRTTNAFTPGDQRVLETLANLLATALGRLRTVKALRDSEARTRTLSEASFEGIGFSENGTIIDTNTRLAEMLGYSVPEVIGRRAEELSAPESREEVARRVRLGSQETYEHLALRKDGSAFPVEVRTRLLPYAGREVRVSAIRDISERREAEAEIRRQLERLAILRRIDSSIAANAELAVTLGLIIDELLAELGVAAAGILVLHADGATLRFAAGRGFHSDVYRTTQIPLADSFAGVVMRERRTYAVTELANSPAGFSLSGFMRMEGFETYLAAPLIAKGEVNGVLEVFHTGSLGDDVNWKGFLEALAGQAAIAIDNATLLAGIQCTAAELAQAYETTLEGWSRALELRDRETQGHTLRVTELAVRLGREMGMAGEDLAQLRRGALLHDIGKVAIPDSILFKPGQLNDEEWAIMRRHTVYARDLLEPIPYLRPALAVPYCHHERWDGQGYPRGLQGEGIPLAARVFAVVDAWDALSSDRPYRAAWPKDEVIQHIRDNAGHHFDPHVVEAFVRLLGQD